MATTNQTISEGLDFDQLRAEGIRQMQRLSSGRWTDFNTHDPGITLLDVLCYALTDLAYRNNWSMPDLIGSEGVQLLQELFGVEKVLPSATITVNDIRKKILDIEGVQNVHIEPLRHTPTYYYSPYEQAIGTVRIEGIEESIIQGFYQVSIAGTDNHVRDVLNNCRPLGCDWEVKTLNSEGLKLVVMLEISGDVSLPKQLAIDIKEKISTYITPSVKTTSYADEKHKGTLLDIIYEGPLLQNGFLADTELDKLAARTYLRVSDLIQILMDIPGVVAVKDIYFDDKKGKLNRWIQPITTDTFTVLGIDSEIHLDRGSIPTLFKVSNLAQSVQAALSTSYNTDFQKTPQTPKRSIGSYHSIRHHLPAIYGQREENVLDMTIPAKQLAAYLIFFEQLLADTFAQLAQAGQLFDFNNSVETSYAVQSLPNIADFMIAPYIGKKDNDDDRFNRLLDHLMARFAENFADYSLLMYNEAKELIADKRAFIKAIPSFGVNRGLGFNYTKPESRSGLEDRIALLLGMSLPLSGIEENFYLVEHILLRPVDQDAADEDNLVSEVSQPDPYSRTVTFVFRATSPRIKDNNGDKWRNLTAQVVRRETPAHIQTNIIWWYQNDFKDFTEAYTAWRKALTNTEGINNTAYRVARDRVVDLLVDTNQKPLIGWHRPILDLELKVTVVPANTEGLKATIVNSQMGVDYTLCDYKGKPLIIPPETTPKAVAGTGVDLLITLPKLTEDTTFRISASKRKNTLTGGIKETKGLLFQKLRVRVGTDVNIPVNIVQNDIRFGKNARLILQRSQAQVAYRLLDANKIVISLNDFTGQQDQPLQLASKSLANDTELTIEAERSGQKVAIQGKYSIRVLPNQDLKLAAKTVVVDYGKTAKVEIAQAQVGVSYFLVATKILQRAFVHIENPKTWTDSLLATALPNVNIWNFYFIPDNTSDYEELREFEDTLFSLKEKPNPQFLLTGIPVTANQATIEIETDALTSDTFLLTTAKKRNHPRGVGEIQVVPVLVMPNLAVVAIPSATAVKKGESITILIAQPQPYTIYSLVLKGATDILSWGIYMPKPEDDNDPIGLEATRIGFDFVIGSDTEGTSVVLQAPPLTQKTEFEIIAEKVRTGLSGKLASTILIDVTEPVPPAVIEEKPIANAVPQAAIEPNPVAESISTEVPNVVADTPKPTDTTVRGLMDMTEEKPKTPKKPRKPKKPKE